jgi:ABC-type glycerol-3-phosphate transport system permease component
MGRIPRRRTRHKLPISLAGRSRIGILAERSSTHALTLTIQEFVYYWGSLMAACVITSIPLAVLYNFFLDRFIAGFTVGAIK